MRKWDKFMATAGENRAPDALIYRLSGVMTNSPETYEFLEDLRDRLHAKAEPVILNLSKVTHITSGGIGILAACHTSAMNAGSRVILTAIPKQAEAVLNVVRLLTILEHEPSEEAALERLRR